MATRASDPIIGFSFALDVQGVLSGFFTEISGLGSETEIVEHKVTDPKGRDLIQKIPGRTKYTDVTLKRGVTKDMEIWQWRKKVEDGDIVGARKNATITVYDQALTAVAKWNLENAWPSKVSGPSLSSDGSSVGVEELSVTFETMVREQV
ncbi:MAG: phage tail protein [Dehalococcoidia bacterium]